MRIGFIGCVESSEVALKSLIEAKSPNLELVGVITKSKSNINNDFVNLNKVSLEHSIPCFYQEDKNANESLLFMKKLKPDVIFCIGWSHILGLDFLELPRYGVIGFHPTKLPANRGRHPIIWSIVLGLKNTASTLFKMDKGADSGLIVSQKTLKITEGFVARDLYNLILLALSEQVLDVANGLVSGKLRYIKQDYNKANVWRKRSSKDGIIDFRMSNIDIRNLISALSDPYPGATVLYNDIDYIILECKISNKKFPNNIEPGYVLSIKDGVLLVKTAGNGSIYINSLPLAKEIFVGAYL